MVATAPVSQAAPRSDGEGLRRDVGLLGLLFASEGSIIRSGWLFGSLFALELAGPAALIGWVVASGIVILLALVHAELGGLFPVSGGTGRFPHFAYGSLAGATFGWFAYVQAATVAPIEVLVTIQYMSAASWARGFYKPVAGTPGTLTGTGIAVASGLMILFVLLNLVGIRWLSRANIGVTTWKVLVPVVAIVVLLLTHFHGGNFSAGGGFFIPGGFSTSAKAILIAIPGGGIVFALLGFEQALQLGGESAHPQRDLHRAVIGSVLIGAALYLLLQFAFIGALDPATIRQFHTWPGLVKDSVLNGGPFYTVAKVAGLAWLAWILRVDAAVSPGGTGLVYLTSSSRIGFGLSRNGYVPRAFEATSKRTAIPWVAVIISAAIGLLFLLPFPNWSSLVDIVTGASVLMYAGAPLALGALRKSKPDLARPYRLPGARILTPLSFVVANFIVYWAGWGTMSTLMISLAIGYLLMLLSGALHLNDHRGRIDWRAGVWLFPYLIGMCVISYVGGFGHTGILGGVGVFKDVLVGGNGELGLWWDLLVLAAFSLGIYYLAVRHGLPESDVDEHVAGAYPSAAAGH